MVVSITAGEEKTLMDGLFGSVSYFPEVEGDPEPDDSDEDSE